MSDKQILTLKKNTPKKVGNTIILLRKTKNITQTELANATGKDRQYIYKIEKGKVSISLTTLVILLKALEVGLDDFFNCFEN